MRFVLAPANSRKVFAPGREAEFLMIDSVHCISNF